MTDLSKTGAREVAAKMRRGEIKAEQVVNYHLAQIQKLNSTVNALCYLAKDQALEASRKLDRQSKRTGRLCGVVCSVKDSYEVQGMPKSDGSSTGFIASCSITNSSVQRLLDEGAIIIGKNNMAQYGKSYFTDNELYGKTNNPYNLECSPGGSGGGDAAAVACDFAKISLGYDAGGSIRIPANFCGTFALFPTRGVISALGSNFMHTTSALFRNNGPLAGNLDDLELAFDVLAGFDQNDPFSVACTSSNASKEHKCFAYFSEINSIQADSEIKEALLSTVSRLEKLGFKSEECVPEPWKQGLEPFIILAAQTAMHFEDLQAITNNKPRNLVSEPQIIKNLRARLSSEVPPLSVENLLKSWYMIDKLRHDAAKVFAKYDFILSPVAASLAPKHGTTQFNINSQNYQSQQVFQFAHAINVLALPAVAFPTNLSKNGLPVGLQIIGPRFSERKLISYLRKANFTQGLGKTF